MLDFMEHCVLNFYHGTNWPLDNSYSTLANTARALLEFYPPTMPFHFVLGKSLSSHFKASYAIGLPPNHHMSFMASSQPINIIERRAEQDLLEYALTPLASLDPKRLDHQRQYLLMGRIYHQDARVEGLYIDRIAPNVQYFLSGVSSLYPDESHLLAKWQYDAGRYSNEVSWTSLGSIFGFRSVYHFDYRQARWSVGGEVYYAGDERSGGLSTGGRYRKFDKNGSLVDMTLLVNPVMGHLGITYARSYKKHLLMATRYDFNYFSYDSDLSVGLIYAPAEKNQLIKGLALVWEATMGNFMIAVGTAVDFARHRMFAMGAQQSIGVEIQYSFS